MKSVDNYPNHSKFKLTERGRFLRDSTIYTFAIGGAALYMTNMGGVSSDEAPVRPEIACTTPMVGPDLGSYAIDYLDAKTDAEMMSISDDVARQSGRNNPSDINSSQILKLTEEQCTVVVDNGGEITFVDQPDR